MNQVLSMCREVRLVAELMYSGLTTGAGLQTLGEEYCDILQAAGAVAMPLTSSATATPGCYQFQSLHSGVFDLLHLLL